MIFIGKPNVIEFHSQMIEEFGGDAGMLNEGALESALMAVENRHFYEQADIAALAATYAYHLTKAHAFLDGNKRTAAVVTLTFLEVNGVEVHATEDERYNFFLAIASSEMNRDQAEEIIRSWIEY